MTVKLVTNAKDLIFTDNGDAEGFRILDAAAGVKVPGEVMTTKISFTDGDDAMTIADGGGVTFPVSIDITGSTGIILENDETITNSTNGLISLSGNLAIPDGGTIGSATVTDAISITSAGRVGLDATSPATTLHVNHSGGAGVRISRDSNAGYLNLDTDGTNAHISNPGGSGTLIFKVNGDNERARIDANGTFTVGTDGSGGDVTFYSATSGDNLTWDASHEVLNITGTNGATALDVLDGDLRVVDTLYLYDRGGESISSDGTDLTIASGDDIFLTATGAVKVADKIGIGTEDAKGAFYFIPLNTQDVSTSATTISSGTDFGVLTFVTGEEGVVRFADLVIFGYDSVTVISSHSVRGSPASRSYSVSGQELKLAMGSGTYDISVLQMMGPDPT